MTATADMLLRDVLSLPIEERSHIASRLIESVDDEEDFELSPAWQAEVARRMESIRNCSANLIPHEEVMASVRHRLVEQRASKV
jgi:putative addiction module component (TIGR02574 family)